MQSKQLKTLQIIALCSLLFMLSCGSSTSNKESDNKDSLAALADSPAVTGIAKSMADTKPWIFKQTGTGEYDEPLTEISVIINDKPYVVAKSVMGAGNLLEKGLWPDYKIPANAISACMAWWAGEGDVFYLVRKNGGSQVYHALIGEGMDLEKELTYEKVLDVARLIK